MNRGEGLLIISFLAWFIYQAGGAFAYPAEALVFPLLVATAGAVLCLFLLWLLRATAAAKGSCGQGRLVLAAPALIGVLALWAYLGAVLLAGFTLPTLAAALFGPQALARNRPRSLWSRLAFSLALVGFIWVVFRLVLKVDFPRGALRLPG